MHPVGKPFLTIAVVVCAACPGDLTTPPEAYVGSWFGHCEPIVSWCDAVQVPVFYSIHADGTMDGYVGDATLVDARFQFNDSLSRSFDNPDYRWEATLQGSLVAAEGITREMARGLLELQGDTLSGQVTAPGNLLFLVEPKENDDFVCTNGELSRVQQ